MHGNAMTISHEVKIHILTPRRQAELNEPLCPPPDVSLLSPETDKADAQIHILLPSLMDLRNIVSRLGQMANDVKLSANLVSLQTRMVAEAEDPGGHLRVERRLEKC
jgi:HUS1 checkpoint protein